MTKCYNCLKANMVARKATIEYKQSGLPYPVMLANVPVRECPACGEQAVTIPDAEGLHRALCLHVVRANRALLGQEVRFLRKYLGWSADHLAAVMGVDPKTLSRWENGRQKLGPMAERFLRILVLQKLEEGAKEFADQVLPTLGHEPAASDESLHMAASRNGWREAA
jgi:putative zinc finger/helix-turn-helix YgiT family protein